MADQPLVSVIVPARNAEATLAKTLASLLAQTEPRWEAILVDDGSADETAAIMACHAAGDRRFQLVSGAGEGVAAARNRGLAQAQGQWLLFLDSDDWVEPTFIARMVAALDDAPGAQLAFCAYRRVMPDGHMGPPRIQPWLAEEPFEIMARSCGAAVHAIVVDRRLVQSLGGFDTGLVTCEDWDLWQRVARTGARWIMVDEPLALYRTVAGSLSARRDDMLRDARTVIDRGFGRDPRVPSAHPDYADGARLKDWGSADRAWALFALWVSVVDALQGGEGGLPVECAENLSLASDEVEGLASTILDAITVSQRKVPSDLAACWADYGLSLHALVAALGARRNDPEGARRLLYRIEQQILDYDDLREPRTLGLTMGLRVPMGRPQDVALPDGVDRIHVWFTDGREVRAVVRFGAVGPLTARQWTEIAFRTAGFQPTLDALPRRRRPLWAAHILGHLIRRTIRDPRWVLHRKRWKPTVREAFRRARLSIEGAADQPGSHRARLETITRTEADRLQALAPVPAAGPPNPAASEAGDRRDRSTFWETLFQVEDPWNYGSAYEQEKYRRQLELLPPSPVGKALEIACAEGHFTSHLAPKVGHLLATDISATALERARARNRDHANVAYEVLDLSSGAIPGGQDLIVCSEVLYYLNDEAELRAVARRIAEAIAPGGHLLTAHAFVLKDDLSRTGFDWDNPFGVATISRIFSETPGLVLARSLETELYRIDLFRRADPAAPQAPVVAETAPVDAALLPDVARYIVRGGAAARRQDVAHERRQTMPVLMYHGVCDDGPAALARWRVTPAMFAAQMRWLRANGYHAIGSSELEWFVRRGHPFTGRPVMITADDGMQSFADQAWPILRAHDMTAELFIVTGMIGKSAEWDADKGSPAPLVDAATIARLAQEGARFGSHLETHRAADGLSTEELARELIASRLALKACVGHAPISLAAPFSISDQRLALLAVECGYSTCFGRQQGAATLQSDLMDLPRIEVMGDWALEDFIRTMEAVR